MLILHFNGIFPERLNERMKIMRIRDRNIYGKCKFYKKKFIYKPTKYSHKNILDSSNKNLIKMKINYNFPIFSLLLLLFISNILAQNSTSSPTSSQESSPSTELTCNKINLIIPSRKNIYSNLKLKSHDNNSIEFLSKFV
jgi:hypothetical protein